jgi:16S rRNA (guanine1207-N2)-methyltransferase
MPHSCRVDPVDELIWDEAPRQTRAVAVIDAPALVDRALTLTDDVRAWCDDWRDAQRVDPALRATPGDLGGVDLVLARLPKSLAALDEQAAAVQGNLDVSYLGGGRIKHMNRSMNETLAQHFAEVTASLGRRKARVLRAHGAFGTKGETPVWPATRHDASLGLVIAAHGATFGGTRLDRGTRLLLEHLDVQGRDVLDLGSGNGVIAAMLARAGHDVHARDVSWSAVASTRATAAANGLEVDVTWGDGLTGYPDASLDAIVTNPPFHQGFAKESEDTLAMFTDAARVLRPGGQLWCVFNSHLPWRRELEARLGRTVLVSQDPRFTVTVTTRG